MDIYNLKSINNIPISEYLNSNVPIPPTSKELDIPLEKMIRRTDETYYDKNFYDVKILYRIEYDETSGTNIVKINLTISKAGDTTTEIIDEHKLIERLSSIKCINNLIIEDNINEWDILLNYVSRFDIVKYCDISKGAHFIFEYGNLKNVECLIMNKPINTVVIFNSKGMKVASIVDSISAMENAFDNFNFTDEHVIKYYGISTSETEKLLLKNLTYENMYIDAPNFSFYDEGEGDSTTIKNVIIGKNNLTSIPNSAFPMSNNLISVKLPKSITLIDDYAFHQTFSLRNIFIPDLVSKIGYGAFAACTSLSEVIISDSSNLKHIEYGAFSGCMVLTNINIPNSITYLGESSFEGDYSLCNINIPTAISKIQNSTFCYCKSLMNIYIPSNIIEIGESSFEDCIYPATITLHTNIQTIGTDSFTGKIYFRIISPTLTQDVINMKTRIQNITSNGIFYYGSDDNWTLFT